LQEESEEERLRNNQEQQDIIEETNQNSLFIHNIKAELILENCNFLNQIEQRTSAKLSESEEAFLKACLNME
jgi:hypothetical protein